MSLVAARLKHPAGVCNVCGALTGRHDVVNHRCDRVVTGRRCSGTYKSGVAFLWDACAGCDASGRVGSQVCSECAGFGWRLYG